jgi:hypothetical protein
MFDLEGIDEASGELFTAVQPGTYTVRVASMKEGTTSDQAKYPGGAKLDFKMVVLDEGPEKGRNLFLTFVIPEAGMEAEYRMNCLNKIKRFIVACGETPTKEFEPEALFGKELKLVVALDSKDKTKNNVKDWIHA